MQIVRNANDDVSALSAANLEIESLHEADRHKDEFLAVLAHELRNPLAGILNGIEVLDQSGIEPAAAAEMRAVIRRQATNMSHLVDGLLDVARIAHGKLILKTERLDLVKLIRDVAEEQRRGIESQGATLRLKLSTVPVWCSADRARLSQVVQNLLGNAAKFLDGPGEVTLEMRHDVERRLATIEIGDTGIGMDAQTLYDIFHPFAQAEQSRDQSRGGLGIGLALVKSLVELHQGRVSAVSDGPGRGSQFSVVLPTCAFQDADNVPGDPQEPSPALRRRILLVDDRRDAILPARIILERAGHEVFTAADGLSGLVLARRILPDIVLLDIGLPGGLDGYDVAGAIRSDATLQHVYLVAVSGYGTQDDLKRCCDSGFDHHMTKPVSKKDLESMVQSLPRFPGPRKSR